MMLRQSVLSLLIIDIVGVENAPPIVGAIWALNVLPGAFLSIFAGIIVDHYDKRRILNITACISMVIGGLLAFLAYQDAHHIAIWKIVTLMAFTGFVNSIDGVARNAILKDASKNASHDRLAAVIFSSLYTFGMILGNGLAGHLVLAFGYGNTFMLNVFSFVVLIYGLSRMDFSHNTARVRTSSVFTGITKKIWEGVAYTTHEKGIRICILLAGGITVFGFGYNVILAIIAKQMFHGGPREYSYLATAVGFGSMAGAVSAALWSEHRPKAFMVIGCLVAGIGQITFAYMTNIKFAEVACFFCGFGFMASFSPPRGAIMHMVKKQYAGTVLGITFMFFYGGMVVSALVSGYVAKHYGCPSVLMICGSMLLLIGVATPFLPGIEEIHK